MRFFSRRSKQDEAKPKQDMGDVPSEPSRRPVDTVQEDSEMTFGDRQAVGPGSPAYVSQPDFMADPQPRDDGFSLPLQEIRRPHPGHPVGSFTSDPGSEPRGSFTGNPSFTNPDTRSWGSTTTQFEWPSYHGPVPAGAAAAAAAQPPIGPNVEGSPGGFDGHERCKDTTSFGSVKTEYEWPAYQEPEPGAHAGETGGYSQMMPPFPGYSMPMPSIPPSGASAQVLAQYAASLQAMAHQYSQMASVAASQEMASAEAGPLGAVGMGMSINPWLLPGHGAVPMGAAAGNGHARRSDDAQANGHKIDPGVEPTAVKEESEWVTVMLRNLPNDYSRDDVVDLLTGQGFFSRFDFVYLPIDFKNSVGLGYAFINMVSHQDALQVFERLSGFKEWKVASQKVCEVAWGNPEQQGLEFHVTRYRNSPVMHPSVPEEFKPLLFSNGQKIPFPEPTKAPRRPRMKKHARIGCRSPEGSEEEEER